MVEAALQTNSRFGKAAMVNIWQAMIDAALTEGEDNHADG